jgi:hypothetical protein
MARDGRFSQSQKIRYRLAQRSTLVVLCLKLWSIRGGGTVRVTECVILFSGMVDSNYRLEKQQNGPQKAWNVYPMAQKPLETS